MGSSNIKILKPIIDYVILMRNMFVIPKDVRVMREAECGSDYYLLSCHLIFKPRTYSFTKKIIKTENEQKRE